MLIIEIMFSTWKKLYTHNIIKCSVTNRNHVLNLKKLYTHNIIQAKSEHSLWWYWSAIPIFLVWNSIDKFFFGGAIILVKRHNPLGCSKKLHCTFLFSNPVFDLISSSLGALPSCNIKSRVALYISNFSCINEINIITNISFSTWI